MIDGIPEKFRDLLADVTRAFAFLATLMKDGSHQVRADAAGGMG